MKLGIVTLFTAALAAQEAAHQHPAASIPLQPLAQQVRQLEEALNYLGQPLSRRRSCGASTTPSAIRTRRPPCAARGHPRSRTRSLTVDINPESRVKVEQGAAKPELVEAGTRLFLVKVINNGHVTAPLEVESPNSGNVYIRSNGQFRARPSN